MAAAATVEKALFEAINKEDAEEVKQLLTKYDPDFSVHNETGDTLLTLACKKQLEWVVRLLLAHVGPGHWSIDKPDAETDTPLIISAALGHSWITWALLANQAELDISNKKGETALYVATAGNHVETIKVLLELGANSAIATKTGDDPITLAARKGYTKVSALLESGGRESNASESAAGGRARVKDLPNTPLLYGTERVANSMGLMGKILQGKSVLEND